MAKIKKFRFYTSNSRYLPVEFSKKSGQRNLFSGFAGAIFKFFYFLGATSLRFFNSIVLLCFHFGNAIIKLFLKTAKAIKTDILQTKDFLPRRFKLIFRAHFSQALFLFSLIALLAWAAMGSLQLIAKALVLKNQLVQTAFLGNKYLSQAKDAF